MNYKKQVLDNATLITVNLSEAGLNQSEEFKNFIYDNSSASEPKLVIDMSNIKYMDSSFIGALVAGLKHVLSKNGEMGLVNIQDDVLALFELTRLDKVFKIYDSVEDALINLK
ncbi:STAS domain-containing protein [Pedobacter cryophilus]|uniref:Anti-sigma factor antagonist n=1 Tax=Pedobacter cryophilus TaxID=2571271 RepID=A0A4U1C1C6_9SPHI|nr:STAS domain-containing protein [Pedobacter cryophilus]TKB97900.1 STAS domain-containing protein [Pedobacter cryophilus]